MSDPLNQGLDHIALRARDLDATVAFYTALGFRAVSEWSAPEAGVSRCVFLDAGDDRLIEVFDGASTPPGASARALTADEPAPSDEERARHASLVHFAVRTDDPAELFRRAVDAGARPVMAPALVDAKGEVPMTLQVAFVHGPDGEVVEFIRRPALREA
ncbi:VOC family protein [Streptomyces sp. NPDC001288]|uniref:VOC family protein n=1 Tax=unclassified Streptomyces TaxID=2593676 RepID=UPI00332567C8